MFEQNKEDIKLEWMYKGAHSNVDREEYLLGRSVDKSLEQLNEDEKQQKAGPSIPPPKNHVEHECIPPSIRDYKQQTGDQVDVTAKLQEDPLIAIKKREEDQRRQFLNNPIQIKKLQKALKSQKKQKKKKKQDGSDIDSDDDIDKKLAKKLRFLKDNPSVGLSTIGKNKQMSKKTKEETNLDTILMHKYNQLKSKLSDDDLRDILQGKVKSSEDESDNSSTDDEKNSKEDSRTKKTERNSNKERFQRKKRRSRSHSRDRQTSRKESRRSRSRSYSPKNKNLKPEFRDRRRRNSDRDNEKYESRYKSRYQKHPSRKEDSSRSYKKAKKTHESDSEDSRKESYTKRSKRSSSSSSSSSSSDSSDDSRSNLKKKNWGLVKADGTKIPFKSKSSKTDSKDTNHFKKPEVKVVEKPKRMKLTEEEKEKKRREMMANAAWRDSERTKTVKQYRETQLKEDREAVGREYNPEFLQKELLKSANSSSVESRIKANINNIQRSGGDMSRNFSRR